MGAGRYSRTDFIYLLFLLTLVGVYALHLFSFTVFDGFSTLSSDSFSYIRLARSMSPYTDASVANSLTLPEHARPPGFPWLLAITGAAYSTYAAHLVVSISMLTAISIFGWMAFRQLGSMLGGLLTISVTLLPGVVIFSMTILSENPYICASLAVLLLYSYIRKNIDCGRGWYATLLLVLTLAILTRTIGVALAMALIVVATLDRKLSKQSRIIFLLIAGISLGIWQLWGVFGVGSGVDAQLGVIGPLFGNDQQDLLGRLGGFIGALRTNAYSIAVAWNNYFSLTRDNTYFFVFTYLLLGICVISLGLRAKQLKFDALYLCFYIGIIIAWPFPEALVRFLHPIIILLLIQPMLYFPVRDKSTRGRIIRTVSIAAMFVLIVNSLVAQSQLIRLRTEAETNNPALRHSVEFYDLVDRGKAEEQSAIFQAVMKMMAESAQVIPVGSSVAVVKHEAYMLLADREAVMLSMIVPYHQQLCNFKLRDVEYIFLSPLKSTYSNSPFELVEQYRDITAFALSTSVQQTEPDYYILKLDMSSIESILRQSGFDCHSYSTRPH